MTARARFKQADVTRALKAVIAAGITPSKVEIDESGRISILAGETTTPASQNPWDDVLK